MLVLGLSAISAVHPAAAQQVPGATAGVITCGAASGWNLVFGSTRDLKCTYQPVVGPAEHFTGRIKVFGVDIGYRQAGIIAWAMLALSTELGQGALAGSYAGPTAGAAAVVGGSVNVLIGGSNNTISLQPLSFEGMAGFNIGPGIAEIDLTPA